MKHKSDEEKLMKWRKDEPPKNGSTFLADFGLPWPVVAAWNGCDENWVYANLQVNMVNGIYNDTYFETEREERIIQWMALPDIPDEKQR